MQYRLIKIVFLVLFLIISVMIIMGFIYTKKAILDEELKLSTKTYSKAYSTVYKNTKKLSQIVFSEFMNIGKIEAILFQIKEDENLKNELRLKLYNSIKDRYQELKSIHIRQVHIHLPNSESFLRMHKPNKYGDKLAKFRETIMYVILNHKPIDGFELGRIYGGFRFVYPIIKEDIYLGSMEVSFGADEITSTLMDEYGIISGFFVKEIFLNKKILKEQKNNYMKSYFDGYLIDKKVLAEINAYERNKPKHQKPHKYTLKKVLLASQQEKISTIINESINKQCTIIPVQNPVTKKYVAFLTIKSDAHQHSFNIIEEYFYFLIIFSIFVSALILYALYSLIHRKQILEESLQKKIQENSKHKEMLFAQSRLTTIGETIVNIAHQWRQPLNAVGANITKLEMLNEYKLKNPEISKVVINSNKSLEYMSQTITNFSNYFAPSKERKKFNLAILIDETLNIFKAQLLNENIKVINIIQNNKISVDGYKNEFMQVLLIVLNNAKDSILLRQDKEAFEGEIIINLRLKDSKIILSIKDNGGGIQDKYIDKIFDPYFTTKHKSQGTGIGLYMSKMIIHNEMNGLLEVKNVNNGVIFKIILN